MRLRLIHRRGGPGNAPREVARTYVGACSRNAGDRRVRWEDAGKFSRFLRAATPHADCRKSPVSWINSTLDELSKGSLPKYRMCRPAQTAKGKE